MTAAGAGRPGRRAGGGGLSRLALLALLALGAAGRPGVAGPDKEYGAFLSGPCVTCHQLSGAAADGVPAIVGLPPEAFAAAMADYRSGARPSAVMRLQADGLSDEEIAALAAYFADVKPHR